MKRCTKTMSGKHNFLPEEKGLQTGKDHEVWYEGLKRYAYYKCEFCGILDDRPQKERKRER